MRKHKKKFGVYHWDTFDDEILFLAEFDTLKEAVKYVWDKYGEDIKKSGADQVDIVNDKGDIVVKYKVG